MKTISFARQEHSPMHGVVNSEALRPRPFIYPTYGVFHSTRHWFAQLMIDAVCLAWWITMMGVFGLAFSLPIIMFALLVK